MHEKKRTAYINTDIHNIIRDHSLSAEQARMYIFLLSNPYCGSFGVYHLPLGTLASCLLQNKARAQDIAFMEKEKRSTLNQLMVLQEKGLAVYDAKIEYVALPDWFHHNKAEYANNAYEFERLFSKIPNASPVFSVLIELINKVAVAIGKQFLPKAR